MGGIFVVAEHRRGKLRDISYEMLYKAHCLAEKGSLAITAILLADKGDPFASELARKSDRVLVLEDERLKTFNPDLYKEIIYRLLEEHHPFITLIGHTSWGMAYAPALSVKSAYPLATDCVDILMENGGAQAIRQIYSGKVFSRVSFKQSKGYLFTVRSGAFLPPESYADRKGEIIGLKPSLSLPQPRSESLELVDTAAGEVDIAQADLLVSIGRGIHEEENIAGLKELAELLGGTLSCSRPIVDKNWLPKYRQVGTSGKSVRPKVYLALGISGAFQHVAGIAGAGTVIAVNKDKKAPIFRVAHYGVAEDLFKVTDALKAKLGK